MSELITLLFNQILIEKIETELLTYYINYNKVINIEEYKTIVKELVKNKYNFKIIEPSEIVFFKNLYEKKFNKRPNGKKANDITWLKTQLNEVDYNQYEISELIRNNIYKPRYVSRMHFSKKKNKPMARLWNDHYGGQCSHTKIKGDYCNVHNKILIKYGKLQFGRIDETKPDIDYFNHNKLNWKN